MSINTSPADIRLLSAWEKGFDRIHNSLSKQVAMNRMVERTNTKVIGMYNKQHGIALGMVYDLSLMTGAFRNIKKAIDYFFLADYWALFKKTMFGLGQAIRHPITAIKEMGSYFKPFVDQIIHPFKAARGELAHQIENIVDPDAVNQFLMSLERIAPTFSEEANELRAQIGELRGGGAYPPEEEAALAMIRTPADMGEYLRFLEESGNRIGTLTADFTDMAEALALVHEGGAVEGLSEGIQLWELLTNTMERADAGITDVTQSLTEFIAETNSLMGTFAQREGMDQLQAQMTALNASPFMTGELKPPTEEEMARKPTALQTVGEGLQKPAKFFNKQVLKPMRQIAGAGVGMGFQTLIMGMMQAFASLFNVFQPVIDVITSLVEMVGTGFQPIVNALLEALTSPSMMSILELLTNALGRLSTALAPLMPIIVQLISIALIPIIVAVELLAAVLELLAPYFPPIMAALDMLMPYLMMVTDLVNILSHALYGSGLGTALDIVAGFVTSLEIIILSIIGVFTQLNTLILTIVEGALAFLNATLDVFKLAIEGIQTIIQTLVDGALTALQTIIDGINTVVTSLVEGSLTALETIIQGIDDLITTLVDGALTAFETIMNSLESAIESVGDIITDIIDSITDLIDSLNELLDTVTGGGGGGGGGNALTDLLGLQTGGYATTPTRALIAETAPEFVFTQEQARALAAMGISGEGGGSTSINITINGVAPGSSVRELATLIGRELRFIK